MIKISKKMIRNTLATSVLLAASAVANSAVIVLDFEGVGDNAFIQDFYNGGTDSLGNSGTNHGIAFGSDAQGLIDGDAGGSGNFANEPSADTAMYFLSNTAVLNYAPGFNTGFSFFYTSSTAATVDVWDGLGATGNLLATLNLTAQHTDNCAGDPNGTFCNWTAVGSTFMGTAMSIDFGGTANQIAFDEITFGSEVAGGDPVNAPAGLLLTMLGLGYIARKRLQSK